MISGFFGEHRFLSNFYPAPIVVDGLEWPSVEHAYQAAKSDNFEIREIIRKLPKANMAKDMGGRIECRPNWKEIRLLVMERLLRLKFAPGTELARRLIATQPHELVENNWWSDHYWGVCDGWGENNLGLLLMLVRNDLIAGLTRT